jgi:hypothetical protein
MTSKLNRMLVVLLLTALAGVTALAKGKTENFTFMTDVKVNGTLVKKGTYSIKYDETNSEILILKNGKTIAKAPAKVEQRDKKARSFEVRSTGEGENVEVTGIAFEGSEQNIVVTPSAAQNKN